MAPFNTAAFPDSLALGKPDSLLIGAIDEIQVGFVQGDESKPSARAGRKHEV
jgi:hypothetical protein